MTKSEKLAAYEKITAERDQLNAKWEDLWSDLRNKGAVYKACSGCGEPDSSPKLCGCPCGVGERIVNVNELKSRVEELEARLDITRIPQLERDGDKKEMAWRREVQAGRMKDERIAALEAELAEAKQEIAVSASGSTHAQNRALIETLETSQEHEREMEQENQSLREALRVAVDKGPHGGNCKSLDRWINKDEYQCNCWRSLLAKLTEGKPG